LIKLCEEIEDDFDAVRALTISAFTSSEFGHNGEADLIDALRDSSADHLSLVAKQNDEIVGHVMFTPVTILAPQNELTGMGLAPMSVAPHRQKTGIGSSLLNNGLVQLFSNNCSFVLVLGHSNFYTKFGFQPASKFNISHGFSGIPQDVFFIRWNTGRTMELVAGGRAFYQPEFGTQHNGT
jgi:putative acetyltransferase